MTDERTYTTADEAAAPLLPIVALGDLADAQPPANDYIITGLLPRSLVLLGGHGGAGKSILALIIAAHVAAGANWCGHALHRGRVLFVSLEDPAELVRWRLRKILETYDLDPQAVAENLVLMDGSGADAALMIERIDGGARWMLRTPAMLELAEAAFFGATLIVIDNASDAFAGNENDRRLVRAFMRELREMGRTARAAVLLLAHIDKAAAKFGGQGNNYSGSTAWHNSARARFALKVDGACITLEAEKNNLGKLPEPLHFRWSEHGVLIPTTPAAAADAMANDPNVAADNGEVLALLRSAGCDVPTATVGAYTAYATLKHRHAFPQWAGKGAGGKRRFLQALERLERIGKIRRETYTTRSRHQSERWQVVDQ